MHDKKPFGKKFPGKNRNQGKFQRKPERFEEKPVKLTIAEAIKNGKSDRNFLLEGIIGKIAQTPGPTIFNLSDGTGSLVLKGFEGAGERAYPEIEEGDAIRAEITLEEFRDELEGEISWMKKLSVEEKEFMLKNMAEIERKRAEIDPPQFLVEDNILEKLKPEFIKAATEIRLAIFQNRPIIVRHHNDTDGYSSGFALEKAILPLIEKQHVSEKAAWEFYSRAPSQAPYYEIDDSIRDTANSLRNEAKFSNKMPLVIITDNGSAKEDLMGILQGKVHGMDFVVIDHHVLGDEDVISEHVLAHINPFLVGESGEKFSAGMLCSEAARFINPEVKDMAQIAAMAGISDRIKNEKAIQGYLDLAKQKGYNKEMLSNIAAVIDFVSTRLRFMEAREYIEVLFGEPMDRQRALVELMAPYILNLEKKGLAIGKSFAKIEKIGETTLQTIMVEESFPGFGFYPKPGKVIGLLHDDLQKVHKLTNVVSIGVLGTAMTIRATDEANFSVHDLIKYLNKHVPTAHADGGGHKNAGAITFLPVMQPQVLEKTKEYISSL